MLPTFHLLPASTNHHRLEMPNQRHWNWNRYPAKVKSQPTRVRRPPFSNNENTKEWNGNLGGQNRGQSRDIWTTRSCLGLWRSLSFISFHHQYGRLSFASFWTIRVCCRFATAWKEHMIKYMDPTGTEKSADGFCLFVFVMPSETSCRRQLCRSKKMSNVPRLRLDPIGVLYRLLGCIFKLFRCAFYFYENMMLCIALAYY
jgi:hypothetical protein